MKIVKVIFLVLGIYVLASFAISVFLTLIGIESPALAETSFTIIPALLVTIFIIFLKFSLKRFSNKNRISH